MASDKVKAFTDDNFETEVLNSDTPVLVDFWAEWCMPCRMVAPIIDSLAGQYEGKVKVGKVDTDANRKVAMNFGITAIPTVILFKDGQVHSKIVGLKSEDDFKKMLNEVVA